MKDADNAGFRVESVTLPKATQPVQVVVIEAQHVVDGPVLDALRDSMANLRAACPRLDLILDLGHVDMLSSAAIGLLGMEHRTIWNAKGRMKICEIRPAVMQVFKITRLDGYFDIYETRAAALASL